MDKIKSFRDEAIRLIALQKDLLQNIKEKVPTQQHQDGADTDGKQQAENEQFTPKAIDKKIASLEENSIKLQELDMVLAVVGTMKAGKSTCINAIVGREILPNRNRPMTALPTLIRHVPGAEQAVLHFNAKQQKPIQRLIRQLHDVLKKGTHINAEKIDTDNDLKKLAESITNHFVMKESYAGEEGIFEFLKSLNDLVRLSKELGVAFPFESYTSVDDFPLIEVEFFHLKQTGKNNTLGRFTLLDTPGFNEAGQSDHLLPMLQEQLSKATAVLAVLDYSQLKSESEEDLRKELLNIAKYSKGRMFALVNKFEKDDCNSDDEAQTRNYVAQNLLPGIVPKEKIFPVSGRSAYWAKRAELELAKNGNLNWIKGQKENWIDDFGKKVFGMRYEKYINNCAEVEDACKDLWKKSLFDKPLSDVIQYSNNNAAQMAIQAATDKLNAYAQGNKDAVTPDGIGAMLKLRLQGFNVDAEELSGLVEGLNAKLKELKKHQNKATQGLAELMAEVKIEVSEKIAQVDKQTKKAIKQFMEQGGNLSATAAQYREELKNTLENFSFYNENPSFRWPSKGKDEILNDLLKQFPSGDKEAHALLKKLEKMRQNTSQEDVYAIFPSSKSDCQKDIHLMDEMVYGSTAEASGALKEIDNIVSNFLSDNTDAVTSYLDEASKGFKEKLNILQAAIKEQVAAFKKHASTVGFDYLEFNVPKINSIKLKQGSSNTLSGLIQDNSYTTSRKREQSGAWGWLKRKADIGNNGWGTDDYDAKVSKFTFLKKDLQAHYDEHIRQYSDQLKNSVESSFTIPLEASKDEFFESMQIAFSMIRENMEASLRDQEKSVEQKIQIKQDIQELYQTYSDNVKEIDSLVRNTKNLTSISAPTSEAAYA